VSGNVATVKARIAKQRNRINHRFAPENGSSDIVICMEIQYEEIEPETVYIEDEFENEWPVIQPVKHGRPLVYAGDSGRAKRRKKALNREAFVACPSQTISSYFLPIQPKAKSCVHKIGIDKCMEMLNKILQSQQQNVQSCQCLKTVALSKYFVYRLANMSSISAVLKSAESLPTSLPKNGRSVENWARYFQMNGVVPQSNRGKHQKTSSLVFDVDIRQKCIDWLRIQAPNQRTPIAFQHYLAENIIPFFTGGVSCNVSLSTRKSWMQHLGYKFGSWKQDVFYDGHERSDVAEYRSSFCVKFMELYDRMVLWGYGDNMANNN
jgi:hypothetical protein